MTDLNDVSKAIIQLFNVRRLIDDGYHNKEINELIKISNNLFEELDDADKEKIQILFDIEMNENDSE